MFKHYTMLHINKLLSQFISCVLLLKFSTTFAQNDVQFNTYNYDLMQLNVGAMGSSCFEANLNYRTQPLKVGGAPSLYQLNSYLRFGDKQAVGIKVYHQSVGLSEFNNITGAYAYKLNLSKNATFNLGVGVSFFQTAFNAHKAVVTNENDEVLQNDGQILRANNFDCEIGGELKWKELKTGLSVNHLYNTDKNMGNVSSKTPQLFNLYATYKFNLSQNLELMPWLLTRYSAGGAFLPEVMVNARYKKMFSLGVGYRYPSGIIANFGAELAKIKIVYSFEYNLGKIYKSLGSTHQIMLGFDLCQKKKDKAEPELKN